MVVSFMPQIADIRITIHYTPNPDPTKPYEHNTKTCSHQLMIAEVGIGTKGNWQYGVALPATGREPRPDRWCFGLDSNGRIGISMMEARKELDKYRRLILVFRVHKENIEKQFPYGLSNVGLLVMNGKKIDPPPAWPRVGDETAPRTALAWTTGQEAGGHIFFVTTSGATWDQVADFIRKTLPDILKGQPYNTHIDPSTINAVMLDGGGSTKFGYRLNPRKASTYQGFPREQDKKAPNSQRYLTTYITAEATFKE